MTDHEHEQRQLTYFVNGEEQETHQHRVAVRTILSKAGFDPAEQYQLERDAGHHIYQDYNEEVPLHQGERFTATYLGPTPTS